MKIGLIGYGGVGQAFVNLIEEKKEELIKQEINLELIYILKSDGGIIDDKGIKIASIKDINIKDSVKWIDKLKFEDVVDKNIDLLVELTPTNKNTGEPALSYIKKALERGVNVVTGNKGPILMDYKGLKELAKKNGATLGIGCTTGGALPSISGGLVDCAGSKILAIEGILNGTSNFILKDMEERSVTYEESLKEAQKIGIAETNPTLDVDGYDTAIKMVILSNVLLGSNFKLEDVKLKGITKITSDNIDEAKAKNNKIKLIGKATLDGIIVEPMEIDANHKLYGVDGKNKGVCYYTDTLGDISIIGGESGTINAAAAILRDVINIIKCKII